jgi:proline iminopeptidase
MALVHLNQTSLFYTIVKGARPCLVMHGGLGLDHTYLHPWLNLLAEQLELIYYDHRGNGRSGRPPVETLTHEQFARDAEALRKHLGFSRLVIIGHSYGGFIALEYALLFARRVSHLILIDTAPAYNHTAEIRSNIGRKNPPDEILAALRAPIPTEDEELERVFKATLPLYFFNFDSQLGDQLFARTIWSASAAARNQILLPRYNVISRLKEIKAPALIIVGSDDFICPPSQAELLHAGLPGSELVVVKNSGHFPYVEQPEPFFQAVLDWLSKYRN